jgi:hypothetical protein
MSAPRRRSRAIPLWIVVVLGLALLVLLLRTREDRRTAAPLDRASSPAPEPQPAPEPRPNLKAPSASPPSPQGREPSVPAAPSQPHATWPRATDVESHCHGIGAYGVCDGSLAKACVANAVYSTDCAAQHKRCVMTDEGAQCVPSDPKTDCSGSEPAACAGGRVRLCIVGSFQEIDCAKRGGSCRVMSGSAHCSSEAAAGALHHAPARTSSTNVEICDGRDNDSDGHIDENEVCSSVPLVAFVPGAYDPSDLNARMQQELEILNRVYTPTTFHWAKTASTDDAYVHFDPKQMTQAAAALARSAYPSFYVAVLYVRDMLIDPPKGGMSTMPNARCGGTRLTDRPVPADGLIVLTEARQPETLAHEMGHYLGLCHTHQQLAPIALAGDASAECKHNGDGICETPFDPGPNRCVRDEVCEVLCPSDDAEPSPINIMSYYIGCRQSLTPEQLTEARRNLSLRRVWFRCLDPAACACTPGATACPVEMSCQPGTSLDASWACRLDGAAQPGSTCGAGGECSQGSFCLQALHSGKRENEARCVRACSEGDDCTCIDVGLAFRICSEDMPEGFTPPGAPH